MVKVFMTGNLTKDPELTETITGKSVCRFTLAANRRNANGEKVADFYNITAWNVLGENIARYCSKGAQMTVFGNMEQRKYTAKDGTERVAFDIIAQDAVFGASSAQKDTTPRETAGKGKNAVQDKLEPLDDDADIPF